VRRYIRILTFRPAALPFAAAVLGRLPISMVPLGMVLLVQEVTGSYGDAGVLIAVFALSTALTAPVWGRLLDVLGQPRVVGPTSVMSAAFLAAFAVATVSGAGTALLLALSAGVGLAFPPITSAMRGAWRVVLSDAADLRAAYALDPVAIETVFILGPLVVSALLVLTPPVVPLLVTAALLGGGGGAYSLTAAARAWRPEPHSAGDGSRSRSPLLARGVVPVLLVTVAMSVGFGQLDVAIPATAREQLDNEALVGLLFLCIAGGSAAGGLAYGSWHWRSAERRRMPVQLAGFALGLTCVFWVVGAGIPSPTLFAVVLVATGVCIAPTLIALANLVDHLAPRDRLGEAQAWLSTAFTSGGSLGAAVAGASIDAGGPARAFLGAAAAVALATALALVSQPLLRTADARDLTPEVVVR
jgi:MFS family permease